MSKHRISHTVFAKETVAGGTVRCPLCRTYLREEEDYNAQLNPWEGQSEICISWHCRHCHTECEVRVAPDPDWWEDYFECGHPYAPWDWGKMSDTSKDAISIRAHFAITKILARGENRPFFQELVERDQLLLEDLEDVIARLEAPEVPNAQV